MASFDRYINNLNIALEAIIANQLRSILTALGIIFGVGAVISMLAIGNGARQEILEQIKLVGVNNIIITPIIQDDSQNGNDTEDGNGKTQKRKFSPGLTLEDFNSILEVVPSVNIASPEVVLNSYLVKDGRRTQSKVSGVTSEYFQLYNLPLESGTLFTKEQEDKGLAVCIIGGNVKTRFFSTKDPLNQYIKCGNTWLKVIGVLEKSKFASSAYEETGVTLMDDHIYIPVKTMLLRIRNRGLVNAGSIKQESYYIIIGGDEQDTESQEDKNYNQLDKIIIQVKETDQLQSTANVIYRLLLRRHHEIQDYEITVPELLLKQQQKTKDIFNIVLGAIASISLIVGGIGIMNIMFASVMERIREIGIRLAIGANKKDIIAQFMSEAVLISVTGGIIGVILGVIISKLITHFTGIKTIISWFSVFIAFGVSVAIGIIFGYSPAKKASEKDPIESLRHE